MTETAPERTEPEQDSNLDTPNVEDKKGGKKQRKKAEPFRRVREEEVEVFPTDKFLPNCLQVDSALVDNSYEGTFGGDGWGAKASRDLLVTRGKSFRHEKTKKKRGSYKGGPIDPSSVKSFKFGDDW